MFYDEMDNLKMYLLDPSKRIAAEEAIVAFLGSERIPAGGIQALQGQYSFLQLKDWHDRMTDLLGIPGVTLTDIDEAQNRLKVGLEKLEKQGLVEQELARLGIPREAVSFEETGPIKPLGGSS